MNLDIQSSAATGLIIADSDQRVIAADRIFLEAIGCPPGDIEGRSVAELLRIAATDRLPIDATVSGTCRVSVTAGARRARLLKLSWAPVRLENDSRGALFITVEDLTPH